MQKMHLGPIQVVEYADGYIEVALTACGRGTFGDNRNDLSGMSLDCAEVICAACRRSNAFVGAVSTGRFSPELRHVPRMRTQVYRRRGVYDEARNDEIRLALHLPARSVTAEKRQRLLAIEDEIHAEYERRPTEPPSP